MISKWGFRGKIELREWGFARKMCLREWGFALYSLWKGGLQYGKTGI